jgi:hypothetical protein
MKKKNGTKLIVRIICLVLAILMVGSGAAYVFYTLFA